ncbi:hypothetical protein [Cohnella thailandensis]|uniref:Asl1-like glycosyl hydrolase catalytic domain-containing protein n=1 Tax=Cohnella thailandensis TaxID=557557 RepID=A0A841SVP6_9BACL|nr:hypothetical protein [Cohnella thailandensis]MBB6635049.1 hypothetical protein [Cohnella thailandensis]MBP1975727.1 hypothetical protein [Cohnella thailandensis]
MKTSNKPVKPRGRLRRTLLAALAATTLCVPLPFSAAAHAAGEPETLGTIALDVEDDAQNHVHETGVPFSVDVTPHLFAGDSLDSSIKSISFAEGKTPYQTANINNALTVLTDGQLSYGTGYGVFFDLWNATSANDYVDVIIDFTGVASVQSLALYGFNMNTQFSMREGDVTFIGPDGTETTEPASVTNTTKSTAATYSASEPIAARSVIFRIYTGVGNAWKINLTELDITGKAPDSTFANLQSISVEPGVEPYASYNIDQAQTLLTDGKTSYGSAYGVAYDFFGRPEASRYARITVTMDKEAYIDSLDLSAFNLNTYFSLERADISFIDAEGGSVAQTVYGTGNAASSVAAVSFRSSSGGIPAKTIEIDAYTSHHYAGGTIASKLNLTELRFTQTTSDGSGPDFQLPGNITLTAQWKDYQGQPLGAPISLSFEETTTIDSPTELPTGYYGLVFQSTSDFVIGDRVPGEAKEYGFAVLPTPATRVDRPDSAFGMVHADLEDPNIGGWSKTQSWTPSTLAPAAWGSLMAGRRADGWEELPLVHAELWHTADFEPMPQADIENLADTLADYVQADPDGKYWELGLEENLSHWSKPYYWENLQAKTAAIREAVDDLELDTKLIYQIAEPTNRKASLSTFLASDVAPMFDILSLHPYAWPDFPSPETWLPDILDFTRSEMAKNGLDMPIWFTEVGAPHAGNAPGEYFGYGDPATDTDHLVEGLSRMEEASYLNKVYTLGLEGGVEKIFWYNYKDRDQRRYYPEDHFGLLDYWGYPKPAYLAYVAARDQLDTKAAKGVAKFGDVWLAKFDGEDEDTYILWTDPSATPQAHDLSSLLLSDEITGVFNTLGTPLAIADTASYMVPYEPVFVNTAHAEGEIIPPPAEPGVPAGS